MSLSPEVEHRRALVDLSTLTEHDVLSVWRLVSGSKPDEIRDALLEAVPGIGDARSDMAVSLAGDFYEDARAEAGVRGSYSAKVAPPADSARYEALVRWGVDPLYQFIPDEPAAFSQIAGGLQKIVANQSRQTVELNTHADSAAHGWRRVTSADACRFCLMLAGRGAVYTGATVRFASHGDCNCAAAPAFRPGRPVSVEQYRASKRHQSAADKQATRDNLSGKQGGSGESARPSGFDAMSRQRLEQQVSILDGLKDSDYRTKQLARLHARLQEIN